jgi:hypothetical protein
MLKESIEWARSDLKFAEAGLRSLRTVRADVERRKLILKVLETAVTREELLGWLEELKPVQHFIDKAVRREEIHVDDWAGCSLRLGHLQRDLEHVLKEQDNEKV